MRSSPGLNWTVSGAQEIYTGTGIYYGLCARMSAKQFYDVEVAAGVDPAEVLADLDEQSSLDDAALKQELGIRDFTDLDPSVLPSGFTNAPSRPRGPRPPAGFGPQAGQQKLAVVVWWDTDRDGEYDEDELPADGITVSIQPVLTEAFAPVFRPVVGEVSTDASGEVIVDSLEAGQWDVTATVPDGSDVTWDSEGTTDDGSAQVEVPADSAGYGWVGLVPVDGGTDPGDGGTDPGDGGTDPGDGGTDPGDGGTDPGDGGTDPGDGGTDPGDGGTDLGDGDTDTRADDDAELAWTGASSATAPLLIAVSAVLAGLGAAFVRIARRPRGRRAAH